MELLVKFYTLYEHCQIICMKTKSVVRLPHPSHPNNSCFQETLNLHHCRFHIMCIRSCCCEVFVCLFSLLVDFFCHAMLPHATIKIHLYSPKLVFNMTCRLRTLMFSMWTLRWQSIKIWWTSQMNILLFKNQLSTFKLFWMLIGKSMVKWLKRNIWKFKHSTNHGFLRGSNWLTCYFD
jgi:hypothetical protein